MARLPYALPLPGVTLFPVRRHHAEVSRIPAAGSFPPQPSALPTPRSESARSTNQWLPAELLGHRPMLLPSLRSGSHGFADPLRRRIAAGPLGVQLYRLAGSPRGQCHPAPAMPDPLRVPQLMFFLV